MSKKVPSFRLLFVAFLLPLLTAVMAYLYSQPRLYMSMARIEISKLPSQSEQPESYDPDFFLNEWDKIQSPSFLEAALNELGLAEKFAQQNGGGGMAGAVAFLQRRATFVQNWSTPLIGLQVVSENASEAAALANQVLEVYRRQSTTIVQGDIFDRAVPATQPISPNVSTILTVGFLVSFGLSVVGAWLMRMALKLNRSAPVKVGI